MIVELPVADGTTATGYLALPDRPRGGVIVGMELFGVDAHVRDVCDRLAGLGWAALAPDLYHRSAPGVSLDADEAGRARGFALLGATTRAGALADVRAAVDHLATRGVGCAGMVGLSIGGHLAYLAAAELALPAVAAYYPTWLDTTEIPFGRPTPTLDATPRIAGRVLVLVGAADHLVTAQVRGRIGGALRDAAVRHEIVAYPGAGHGFLSDRRPGHDPAAAADSLRRVDALLATT